MKTIVDVPSVTAPYRVDVISPEPQRPRGEWAAQLLVMNAGVGVTSRPLDQRAITTRQGWPGVVRRVEILDGDQVVERRLVAIFEFAHLAGAVVIRGPRQSAFDEPWILPLLESARPEFSGDIVALADLWK